LITISPIYAKKEERARKMFLPYYLHGENDIISLHNDMIPVDSEEITQYYWELQKPIVYDEVFWIREKAASYEPEFEDSYRDERKWFWSNFINGSMTVRVCWQTFEKTPSFTWTRHLKAFLNEYKWWKMQPFSDRFIIKTRELDGTGVSLFQCRIENDYILYLCAKDGKKISELTIKRKNELPVPLSIKYFNTETGIWSGKIPADGEMGEMSIQFLKEVEDIVLVITCGNGDK
jgi:hypothetical protein